MIHGDVSIDQIESVPLIQVAASFDMTERAFAERLRVFGVPVIKAGRQKRIFVADLARFLTLITRAVAAGPPESSKRNAT